MCAESLLECGLLAQKVIDIVCVGEVLEAVLDVLVIGDGAGAESFICVREQQSGVCRKGGQEALLSWHEVRGSTPLLKKMA